MGKPMAKNLIAAGYPVVVYNRTGSRTRELVDLGASPAESPSGVAHDCDLAITMVTDSPDVEEVVLGERGLIHGTRQGQIIADMSTVSPATERLIGERLGTLGVDYLDAPVTGGEKGAVEASLSIMVGGKLPAFERFLPVFQVLGKTVVYMGEQGAGQVTKLCNQAIVAASALAACEGLVLASKSGVGLDKVLRVISAGAAGSWFLSNLAPKMIKGDYSPGFMIRLMLKDLRLVMALAQQTGVPLPGTSVSEQLFRAAQVSGGGEDGIHGVIKAVEKLAGISTRL